MQPLDTIVFETPLVRAARFRCAASDPRFRDCGPASNCAVVFPRTSVWIQYSGSRSFVADPSIATIYNPGQEYTRRVVSADGDRCEWFGVSTQLALDIAAQLDAKSYERHDTPFRAEQAPVDRSLYLAQRALFTRLERGEIDSLYAEEAIIAIVSAVIARTGNPHKAESPDNDEQRDVVERAKASLSRHLRCRQSLNDLAVELGVSAFHLCRVFRKRTGRTLHEFRTDLRLRTALELIGNRSADLSRTALECGFSSHSHFSAAMRSKFGLTPSAIRGLITS